MAAAGAAARAGSTGAETSPAPDTPCSATWIVAKTGGDAYWRAEAPAKILGGKVVAIPERLMRRAFTQPNSSTPLPWRLELETDDGTPHTFSTMKAWKLFCKSRPRYDASTVRSVFPSVEGTVVWQRPDLARVALSFAMQDEGIRTVAETDDNYFADSSQNLFLRHHRFSDADRLHHARAFACQDACVFSTAHLRDVYRRELRARLGKQPIPELHVCRNHVPLADWPVRVEREGPIRVGFMGSSSHVWDVNLAYAAFHAAHEMGAETIMVGYNPADPDANTAGWDPGPEHRSEKSREYQGKWAKVVDRHIPWVRPDEYHRASIPFDIGLAPLRTDSFTLGKSDVKAVEYTINGVAAVLQNTPVYNSAGWKPGVNCLMASNYEEFAHATLRLMRDARLRYELVSAAQELVAGERSDDAIRQEWGAVIDG